MTEMEADLRRAQIEADAQVKVAEINAHAVIEKAKQERKSETAIQKEAILVCVGVLLALLMAIGIPVFQHINHQNNHAKIIAECQEAGGVWTKQFKDNVREYRGDPDDVYTESWEQCVAK